MKITDVFMTSLAVTEYLHKGILSNFILACTAVYFAARIIKRCFKTEEK